MPKYELFTTGEVPDIAGLRSYTGVSKAVALSDFSVGGLFLHDETDLSSSDDGDTVIVDYKGRRWKRAPMTSLSFTASGTGARSRSGQAKMREIISPDDFDAASSAATAIGEIETAYPDGVGVTVPTGTYTLDSALLLDEQRMNLVGAGKFATTFAYNLAAAGPAITINEGSAGGCYQSRLSDFAFTSNNSTAKTGIDCYNVANIEIARIATNSGLWPGDSIGVRLRGRQSVHFHNSEIGCNRPLVISPNASFPSLAVDHFNFDHLELLGNSATRDVIEVESGVSFANTSFYKIAIVGGRHGFYYDDTTSTAASFKLTFTQCRSESGMDAAAYSYYIASTAQSIQDVVWRDCVLDSARNGVYLRNVQKAKFDNVTFGMAAGKTAYDITIPAGGEVIFNDCYFQSGSTKTITNGRLVSKTVSTSSLVTERWVYDASPAAGTVKSQTYDAGYPHTLAAGATVVIADGAFTGFVEVYRVGDVGAIFFCRGATGTVAEVYDSNAFFGTSAGSGNFNLYLSGGNYILQNNTASSAVLHVKCRGSSNNTV